MPTETTPATPAGTGRGRARFGGDADNRLENRDERERREPGPDHPISIVADPARVIVRVGATVVADSTDTLRMEEARYPTVRYVPLKDVDETLLRPSKTTTYCPFKGEAGYHSLSTPDGDVQDAIWFYESPYPAVDRSPATSRSTSSGCS